MSLTLFQIPFSTTGPPDGLGWEEREHSMSEPSTTVTFKAGLRQRDTFLGRNRCIVCGGHYPSPCHIIGEKEGHVWEMLRKRNWIPQWAKSLEHEPRNGLLMCVDHRHMFNNYDFFIRFVPERNKFVFINYSDPPSRELQPFHGKDVALDITHRYAPLPSTLLIHEMRVRGFHPFLPFIPPMPPNPTWQDWIINDNIFDQDSDFSHHGDWGNPNDTNQLQLQPKSQSQSTVEGTGSSLAALDKDVVNNILTATHAMQS